MEKPKIQIIDTNAYGSVKRTAEEPSCIWQWNSEIPDFPVTVFTDRQMLQALSYKSKVKIAWLFEPPVIDQAIYDFVKNNHSIFDLVMTYDKSLMGISNNISFYTYGSTWIAPENRNIYKKSKEISMIASAKNYAPGHLIRHTCVNLYRDKMDVMGRGYRQIATKEEGLKEYRYSVAIENCSLDDFFTEKLMDCFMTGTVPVYWGCKSIGNYFDLDGMICFSEPEQLKDILGSLNDRDYADRLPAIERNLKKAQEYANLYENAWNGGIKNFFG